jgi:hypothetical protein
MELATLQLEDLLDIGSEADLQVFIFGYEGVTGTRKLFESPKYTIDNIKNGGFDPFGVDVLAKETVSESNPTEPKIEEKTTV